MRNFLFLTLALLLPQHAYPASGAGKVDVNGYLQFKDGSTPASPSAGYRRIYTKSADRKLYTKDGTTGTETKIPLSGDVSTDDMVANAITNAKLAQMAESRAKCRASGSGTGDPQDCTEEQIQKIVGLVPQLLKHQATPASPSAGFVNVYAKSDNQIYILDSTGTESQVQASGGGVGAINTFTMTVTGSSSNPTKSTAISSEVATYQCIGNLMHITWDYRGTSGGADGSGIYLLTVPNSKSIDTSLRGTLPAAQSGHVRVGSGILSVAAAGFVSSSYAVEVYAYDATRLFVAYHNAANTLLIWGSANTPMSTNPLVVSIQMSIPIDGTCN